VINFAVIKNEAFSGLTSKGRVSDQKLYDVATPPLAKSVGDGDGDGSVVRHYAGCDSPWHTQHDRTVNYRY
jgi:hypothetical protein